MSRSKVGVWLLGVLDTGMLMLGVGGVGGSMSVIISFITFNCCRNLLGSDACSCTTGGGGGGGRLLSTSIDANLLILPSTRVILESNKALIAVSVPDVDSESLAGPA